MEYVGKEDEIFYSVFVPFFHVPSPITFLIPYSARPDSTSALHNPEPGPASLVTLRLLIEQIWLGVLRIDT